MAISRIPVTSTNPIALQASIDRLVQEVNRNLAASADAKGKRLTHVSKPVASGDAVSLSYLKSYVDNVVGSINISGNGSGASDFTPLPYESLGEITITGTIIREWQTDGSLRLYCDRDASIGYVPGYVGLQQARYIGEFQGVNVFWENADEPDSPLSLGSAEYTGAPSADPPANLGEVDVIIPRGKIKVGTNYLHLRPYGENRRLRYKPHTSAPNLTYWLVPITQDDLDNNPVGSPPGPPAAPTSVITKTEDASGNMIRYGASWSLPGDPSDNSGYEVKFEFYYDSGGTQAYYDTYAGWVEGGYNTIFWVRDPQSRDAQTVYVRAYVRATGNDLTTTDWVAGTIIPVTPTPSNAGPGPFSVAITVDPVAEGPAHFYVNETLTPPDPLNGAVSWESELGFFDAASGGTQTHPWTPLGNPIDITDVNELHGPFERHVPNPDEPPYAQARTRLILRTGAKTEWVLSNRAVVTKASAPTTTLTNQSTLITDTINGKPSYRINKKVTLSGSKLGLESIKCTAFFYTNSGGTTLDGEIPLGDLDPKLNDTWPVVTEQMTDWWDRPDYNVWYKIGVAAVDAVGTVGTWVYTTLTALTASTGFDASGIAATTLGDTLVISGGKLTNYALTELTKWGLDSDDFDGTNPGNLQLNNAVITRLLTQTITLTGTMTILDSGGNQNIRLDSTGILLGTSSRYVNLASGGVYIVEGTSRLDLTASAIQMKIGGTTYVDITTSYTAVSNQLQVKGTGTAYMTVDSSKCQLQVEFEPWGTLDFTNAGSVSMGSKASDWRTAMGVPQKQSITGTTLTLAKITSGGTDGSISFNGDGLITGYTAPT